MKPNTRGLVITALGLLFLTGAQAPPQFARQWPITLSRPDAGAYRIALNADVYAATYWRDLRDVRVIDADGKPVASEVQPAPGPATPPRREQALRWFALPARATSDGQTLEMMIERNTDGTVIAIHDNTAIVQRRADAPQAWLIDRGAHPEQLYALTVDWVGGNDTLDQTYQLEGSDDLRDWQLLDPQFHLMELRNQGQQLRQNRVQLDTSLRYLRLLPLETKGTLAPAGFRGEVSAKPAPEHWEWLDLSATPGPEHTWIYRVQGRYPIQQFDVVMPANSSAGWTVESRDPAEDGKAQPQWNLHAFAVTAWSLSANGHQQQSLPMVLDTATSDRQWRLRQTSGEPLATAPTLRLGYRHGNVVFLAQGRAPYRLAAGSAAAAENHADLGPMLTELRNSNGAQWQPATSSLGAGSAFAGASAYQPTAKPTDWKSLLLWAVLALGALTVGGFSLSLLRGKPDERKG